MHIPYATRKSWVQTATQVQVFEKMGYLTNYSTVLRTVTQFMITSIVCLFYPKDI